MRRLGERRSASQRSRANGAPNCGAWIASDCRQWSAQSFPGGSGPPPLLERWRIGTTAGIVAVEREGSLPCLASCDDEWQGMLVFRDGLECAVGW